MTLHLLSRGSTASAASHLVQNNKTEAAFYDAASRGHDPIGQALEQKFEYGGGGTPPTPPGNPTAKELLGSCSLYNEIF